MTNAASEMLYGFHPVHEALRAGRRSLASLMIRKGRRDQRTAVLCALAAKRGIPLQRVDDNRLHAAVGHAGHQGVCAQAGPLPYQELPSLLARPVSESRPPCVLLLDGLQDPHNLGAIVRTAFCAGVDGIVIPRDRSTPASPAVSKASAGALEHMPIARVTNLVQTMRYLKEEGLWLVGLDGAAEQMLFDCDLTMPLGLVVGGEDRGVRPLVKRHCDFRVAIPHARAFNSLNASVAAALAMYEVFRQRSRAGRHA
jgi:23S rRNA (guanosine2251-2'-O)-methyltransferase